jgi:IclR family acetate operon transcriptional repressor
MATRGAENGSGSELTRSVNRALAVLEALAARPSGATPKEISHALGIHLSTSYRLLNTLVATGYAARSPRSGLFRLGPRVAYLHHGFVTALRPPAEAVSFVHALQLATGETAILSQLEGDDAVSTAVAAGSRPGAFPPGYVGLGVPAYAIAAGRAILAWLPTPQLEAYLSRTASTPPVPPFLPLDAEALRRELEQIRREGVAFDRGEGNPGDCCIAAPISDGTGVVGAICTIGPCARLRREESALVAIILQVARSVSALLLGTPARDGWGGADHDAPETATQTAVEARIAIISEAMSRVGTA